MFYLVETFRTSTLEAASRVTLRVRTAPGKGGRGGARSYRSFATKGGESEYLKIIINEGKPDNPSEGLQRCSLYGKMQESGLTEIIPLI